MCWLCVIIYALIRAFNYIDTKIKYNYQFILIIMKCRVKFTPGKAIGRRFAMGLITLLILFSFSTSIYAQETIPTTGGNATGSGGSVSYSVGQIIYTSCTGENGSVDPGVQHPYEITLVTSIDDPIGVELICAAYPNPVNDFLTLEVKNSQYKNLSYLLYDMNGRIIDSQRMTDFKTIIPMANFHSATYFLKILNNHTEIKTFKIIKK